MYLKSAILALFQVLLVVFSCSDKSRAGSFLRAEKVRYVRKSVKINPKKPGISDTIDKIIQFGNQLIGKPYRYPIAEKRILDCSGFVSYIYSKMGYKLSYSCGSIAKQTDRIEFSDIRKGDLMFFKGIDKSQDRIGHVAMVTSVKDGIIEFIHSCNRGVIIEKYNKNCYYLDRFLFAARFPAFHNLNEEDTSAEVQEVVNRPYADLFSQEAKNAVVNLVGVGDMMLGSNYPDGSGLPPNDGKDLLNPVKDIISKADLAFGNLEGVLLTGAGNVKQCRNPDVCYAFKSPEHYVQYFKDAGFDLLSIANNHVHDFGQPGISTTMKTLEEAGIHYAGLNSCTFKSFTAKGLIFGFAAFAPNNGTVSINDLENARKIVSQLDAVCDIVIVSFHGGAEGSGSRHITRQTENYLGENRGNPYKFARHVIDAGADVVFGHGPHVTRAVDLYKGRFIAYSMGNFATYGKFNLSGPCGLAPIIELNLNAQGAFVDGKIHSTRQRKPGGPVPDPENGALKEIIDLTKADIPECPLVISADGNITTK